MENIFANFSIMIYSYGRVSIKYKQKTLLSCWEKNAKNRINETITFDISERYVGIAIKTKIKSALLQAILPEFYYNGRYETHLMKEKEKLIPYILRCIIAQIIEQIPEEVIEYEIKKLIHNEEVKWSLRNVV